MVPPRRWLIVVADDQPTLRQGLRLTFADDPTVEVALDRRGAELVVPAAGEAAQERRQPLSPEQNVVWRDLKFFLVDRWKGMAVYEAGTVQRTGQVKPPLQRGLPPGRRADDPVGDAGAGG